MLSLEISELNASWDFIFGQHDFMYKCSGQKMLFDVFDFFSTRFDDFSPEMLLLRFTNIAQTGASPKMTLKQCLFWGNKK